MQCVERSPLWRCVFAALENERALDLHYRATAAQRPASGLPNYKVMKQVALRSRLGWLYPPAVASALVLIPLLGLLHWLRALVEAVLGPPAAAEAGAHIIATTPSNTELVRTSAYPAAVESADVVAPDRLARRIGAGAVFRCVTAHLRLLWHVAGQRGRRVDLLLHSRDAFGLLMLTMYTRMRSEHSFATDDHYQRWSYLLSHNARKLHLVQHGFIDPAIGFPNRFGSVSDLHVRDETFLPAFRRYYRIARWSLFTPVRRLDGSAGDAVFLASSFPTIDSEIELVRHLSAEGVRVIVKFHPAHTYDGRRETLCALAAGVVPADRYPACRVFVSHSSFMEYDYRGLGVPTVAIGRAGGAGPAAAEIRMLLGRKAASAA